MSWDSSLGDTGTTAAGGQGPSFAGFHLLLCSPLCTGMLSFPGHMTEIGSPNVTKSVCYPFSHFIFPKLKFLRRNSLALVFPPRPICCGQGMVSYQPDHPTITCAGGEQFPKEGWLSRQSGRIHPNKHASKDKIVCAEAQNGWLNEKCQQG